MYQKELQLSKSGIIPSLSFSIWDKDNTQLFILLVLSIFFGYYMPLIISRVFFLFFLFFAYRSKHDYFWIAFLFVLVNPPGVLFKTAAHTDPRGLPFYGFPGIALQFIEIFTFIFFVKAIAIKKNFNFIFKKDFIFLGIFLIIVIFYSFVLGISKSNIISLIRTILPMALIYIVPKLLQDENSIVKLDRLLFPFVFVALITQVSTFITGHYLIDYIKGGSIVREELLLAKEDTTARVISSAYIILYCFHKALFYIFNKQNIFSNNYMKWVIVVSTLSIFLTATRGWIIAFSIVLFITLLQFYSHAGAKRLRSIGLTGLAFVIIIMLISPMLKSQISNAFQRFSTVTEIAKGDITAGGTVSRLDIRSPRVMGKFKESPVFGWGFSDLYFEYRDGHVGNQTIMLNVGIVGYIIFLFFFFKWFMKVYGISKKRYVMNKYGKAFVVLNFCFIAIFIIHSTSTQFWGFDIGGCFSTVTKFMVIALLMTSINVYSRPKII